MLQITVIVEYVDCARGSRPSNRGSPVQLLRTQPIGFITAAGEKFIKNISIKAS